MGLHRVKGKGWRYDFTLEGKRYTRAWFPTKAAAIAAREDHRKQIIKETKTQTQTGMVFSELANDYLDQATRRFSAKTYKFKAYVYRLFLAHISDIRIGELSIPLIESYLATRRTNSAYNKHRKEICSLLSWAWKRRLIKENPCLYIPQMPEKRQAKRTYSQEEMVRILMAAGEFRPFLLTLFSLAGRLNEINRLRWEDVNFEKRQVTLWTRKGNGDWRPQVKPMNDELYSELQRIYGKNSGQWVFPNPETGEPYIDRRKQLRRICQAADIPCLGFHAIRHHVASLLADTHKVSLPTIQKILGHARLTTTERYVQGLGDGVREAADLLSSGTQDQHMESKKGSADND